MSILYLSLTKVMIMITRMARPLSTETEYYLSNATALQKVAICYMNNVMKQSKTVTYTYMCLWCVDVWCDFKRDEYIQTVSEFSNVMNTFKIRYKAWMPRAITKNKTKEQLMQYLLIDLYAPIIIRSVVRSRLTRKVGSYVRESTGIYMQDIMSLWLHYCRNLSHFRVIGRI